MAAADQLPINKQFESSLVARVAKYGQRFMGDRPNA
jgi:hypothetical protein